MATINGSAGVDTLYGTAESDVIDACEGNDQIYDGSGDDTVYGGGGDDNIDDQIGAGIIYADGYASDTFDRGDGGNDTVYGGTRVAVYGGMGNDILSASDSASLYGGDGDDVITSLAGTNLLVGDAGNDTLTGAGTIWTDNDTDADARIGGDTLVLSTETATQYGIYDVQDFRSGAGGDVLSLHEVFNELAYNGFDGSYGIDSFKGYNPFIDSDIFAVTGARVVNGQNAWLSLVQDGADVDLYFNPFGSGTSRQLLATLRGVSLDSLVAENFASPVALDGSIVHANIAGTNGNDVLYALDGNDTITGAGGDDSIVAGYGNDVVDGGDGDDALDGGAGNDSLYGGAGNDYLTIGDYGLVHGGADNDVIHGYARSTLYGEGGADHILVHSLALIVDAGDGNDLVDIEYGTATVTLGAGMDTLRFSPSNVLESGLGPVAVTDFDIGPGGDVLVITQLLGWLRYSHSYDYDNPFTTGWMQFVQSGADTLLQVDRDGGADRWETLFVLQGVAATDFYTDPNAHMNFEPVVSPAGNAAPQVIGGTSGDNTLIGGEGDDTLNGYDGNDLLDGDFGGNDMLIGGAGRDSLLGFGGNDLLYGDSADGTGIGDADFIAGGAGNDTIYGDGGDDGGDIWSNAGHKELIFIRGLMGEDGDDEIHGGDGNDTLDGGAGADTLDGGTGADLLVAGYEPVAAGDVLAGGAGNDTLSGGEHDLLLGGDDNDSLQGGDYSTLYGGAGSDSLNAGGSAELHGDEGNDRLNGSYYGDTLDGGAGADTLFGGYGDDLYLVDRNEDVVLEVYGGGIDTVHVVASLNYTLGSSVENLVLLGTAGQNGFGNDRSNHLTGNAFNNLLVGRNGNDTLDGNGGTDTLRGGNGNDVFHTDGGDSLIEVAGQGVDTVIADVSWTLGVNFEYLTLTGSNAINGNGSVRGNLMVGNDAANRLRGLTGQDTLEGGEGIDTLAGGGGSDLLTGGLGADRFLFDTTPNSSSNLDHVVDFTGGEDRLQLENAVFTAFTATGFLDAAAFNYGTAATEADDRIIYDAGTGTLYYDADGTGSTSFKVKFAVLDNMGGLTAGDIQIV